MILTVFVIIASLVIAWTKWKYNHWTRLGIVGPKPSWIFGNMSEQIFMKKQFGVCAAEWYKEFSDMPYIGYYVSFKPCILIRDVELVKNILIQDFQYFANNDIQVPKGDLMNRNPYLCNTDEKWRKSRGVLAPLFTVNKIKCVFPSTLVVCQRMVDYILKFDELHDFDGSDISSRFTTDNVFMTAFSINSKAFTNEKSEFLQRGREVFRPAAKTVYRVFAQYFLQCIQNIIDSSLVTSETQIWFRRFLSENRASRKSLKHIAEDFLEMLLISVNNKHEITEEEIMGYTLTLLVEGYETCSIIILFTLYEIARHPNVQQNLQNEIHTTLLRHQYQVTFDAIHEMKYLDCIINETLRLHPIVLTLRKICTKPYTLPRLANQKESYTIPVGTSVTIPVYGLNMNPNSFTDPEKFIPERFTNEGLKNGLKAAFVPFGEGPRICPGMKFGLAQTKAAIVSLIKGFEVTISKNCKPLEICPKSILFHPKYPVLLNFKPRFK